MGLERYLRNEGVVWGTTGAPHQFGPFIISHPVRRENVPYVIPYDYSVNGIHYVGSIGAVETDFYHLGPPPSLQQAHKLYPAGSSIKVFYSKTNPGKSRSAFRYIKVQGHT
jgi:hypothetical protein